MDLSLDSKQAKALDCSNCDPSKQRVRNCNGAYGEKSQSPIKVNGNIYRSCPRAMVIDDWELGYMVSLYFECRENKIAPFGGSLMNTTAFTKDVFDLFDEIVGEYRDKENAKMEAEHKKALAKANKG